MISDSEIIPNISTCRRLLVMLHSALVSYLNMIGVDFAIILNKSATAFKKLQHWSSILHQAHHK